MSKKQAVQATLFKTWGDGEGTKTTENGCPGPSRQPTEAEADLIIIDEEENVPILVSDGEDEFACEDFDNFLEDEATEAELFQACQLSCEASGTTSHTPVPIPPVKQLKQNTIPFHIGPSASTHSILNCSVVEENIPGFDLEAGEMWIYPTNYPVRDYQFNVVKKALFVNTLVCLPTGLGKTFIGRSEEWLSLDLFSAVGVCRMSDHNHRGIAQPCWGFGIPFPCT